MAALADRLLQIWVTPHGAIKAARLAGDKVRMSIEGNKTVLTFPLPAPLTTTLKVTLDGKNLPEKVAAPVRTAAANPTMFEATYSDYADLGAPLNLRTDVMFPARIVQKLGGRPILDLTVAKVNAYNPYVVFPVPQNVRTATSQLFEAPATLAHKK
jgi:hypothetical protein